MTDPKPPKKTSQNNSAKEKMPRQAIARQTKATAPSQDKMKPETKRTEAKSISIFAILLSVVALVGSGFTWYQTQVEQVRAESSLAVGVAEIGGQISRLGDSISQLQRQQSNVVDQTMLEAKLGSVSSAFQQELKQVNEQQVVLTDSIARINQELNKGVNAYLIDQVSQLLKMANNSAIFASEADSAIKALTLADAQLKGMSDPRFSDVRRKINQEILALQGVETVDIEASSAILSSISKSIPSLPLANEPEATPLLIAAATDQGQGWRAELATLWHEIKSSIQIQKVDQPPKPLLAPQQRYFLNQNLQINLNKAELALLQGRSAVFQQSIDSAIQWLTEYFDLADQSVIDNLGKLAELKNQNVDSELPSITASYQALQAIRLGQE